MYEAKSVHFLLPAAMMVAGTVSGIWSVWLMVGLFSLAILAAAFIAVYGLWQAKGDYWRGIAELARAIPPLTAEQQAALTLQVPEIRVMFGGARPAYLMFADSGVDFAFFAEFMDMSNSVQTWAERDIAPSETESRDARRRKWTLLTAYLMRRNYLATAPAGRSTYYFAPGAYNRLLTEFHEFLEKSGRNVTPLSAIIPPPEIEREGWKTYHAETP